MMIAHAGKLAGLDKKLSRSLEADVQEASSPMELGKSPLGPLSESSRYLPDVAPDTTLCLWPNGVHVTLKILRQDT